MVGIIGRPGAGKSTLSRMFNRLTDATDGAVACEGRDVLTLKGAAMRQRQSECEMICQQSNLVPRLDVMTNVPLGRLNAIRRLARCRGFSSSRHAIRRWTR